MNVIRIIDELFELAFYALFMKTIRHYKIYNALYIYIYILCVYKRLTNMTQSINTVISQNIKYV